MTFQITLFGSHIALVSERALPLVNNKKWYLSKNGYAVTARGELMHRLIIGAKKEEYVDHINSEKLDNRDENLRKATKAENNRHRRRSSHSQQLFKGIRSRKRGTFSARIRFEGKEIYLGTFLSARAASDAYDAAAKQYHSNFAFLNSTGGPS